MTILDKIYSGVRSDIIDALMHSSLAERIKHLVNAIVFDAIFRAIGDYDRATIEKIMAFNRKEIQNLSEDGFEFIMNAVGSGNIKTGITAFIINTNQSGWQMGQDYVNKNKETL